MVQARVLERNPAAFPPRCSVARRAGTTVPGWRERLNGSRSIRTLSMRRREAHDVLPLCLVVAEAAK
jgi:hypothetical protein